MDSEERDDRERREAETNGGGGARERRGDTIELLEGLHVNKRTLWMMAGGAVGALAMLGLGRAFQIARPAALCVLKEGYGFKEWLTGKVEGAKEDVEDLVAEAVFNYQKEMAERTDAAEREKEILARVERLVEERMAKERAEGKEARA